MRAVGYFAPGPIRAPDSLVDIEPPRPSFWPELHVKFRDSSASPSLTPPSHHARSVLG
jgi:hypothetical protein